MLSEVQFRILNPAQSVRRSIDGSNWCNVRERSKLKQESFDSQFQPNYSRALRGCAIFALVLPFFHEIDGCYQQIYITRMQGGGGGGGGGGGEFPLGFSSLVHSPLQLSQQV